MSQPVSRFLHPFEVTHPSFEPEVERAILARWAARHPEIPASPLLSRGPGRSGDGSASKPGSTSRRSDDAGTARP